METLKRYARQPSTWKGLGVLLSVAGIANGEIIAELAGTLFLAALGLWEVVKDDPKPQAGGVPENGS